ncbi:MAG: spermidine synthase [Novosphingobium sp.]|nr:spermidine synthase [Novosphingobium sp.]
MTLCESSDRIPIELVDTAELPRGGQLQLLKCGGDYSIEFGREELMGSRDHQSEQALATLTRARLEPEAGSVLIGGLGMGFTLRAALDAWGAGASIVVAELVPQMLAWAEGPLAHLFGSSLSDPRASIVLADVHDVIDGASEEFDAILLDVDNGPDGFVQPENERLYCNWGLRSAYAALRPGGVLAVWSAYLDVPFGDRLSSAGFTVDEVSLPAFVGSTDRRHNIWFAAKPR